MADTKITVLTAITTVDPAVDVLPIVDISDTTMAASGTTKKITSNQILGAGGTATLASATITGDLTVDTSTLKVDSANNRVGIVQASPAYPLDVTGIIHSTQDVYALGGRLALYRSAGASYFDWSTSQDLVWRQVTSVSGAGASTLMTLNSTGLGVGASPSYRLHVQGTASLQLVLQSNDTNANAKEGTVNIRHYTNAEEPVSAVGGFTTSTANEVYLGGGFSAGNAATLLGFYTAANNTTTIGTERVRVKGTGQVRFVPLAADPSGAEAGDVYYNSTSNKLKCYNGTTWNDLF